MEARAKNVFVFSGQGSQYYQMGRVLYDNDPVFRNVMDETNSTITKLTKVSIIETLYQETKRMTDPFDDLRFSSSALLMVEYSMAQSLIRRGIIPDTLIGTSLGELLSAVISDVLPLEEVIECFSEYIHALEGLECTGGMIAILEDVDQFERTPILFDNSYISAVNDQAHYVVSCTEDKIETVVNYLKSRDIAHQVLPVKIPFHSPLIAHSKDSFLRIAAALNFAKMKIPIYSCVTGKLIETFDKEHYWKIIQEPILFQKAIRAVEAEGTNHYFDLSPTAGFEYLVKRNLTESSQSKCFATMSPMGNALKNIEKIEKNCSPKFRVEGVGPAQHVINPIIRRNQKMRAFVFPGQGSQAVGMGGDLFQQYPDLTQTASDILGYSISELCLKDPQSQLAQTEYTQPAIFMVNALSYYHKLEGDAKKPDYVLGHSLGEFNALLAASVFDFETGLRLVKKRAAFMGKMRSGGMAAVLGLSEENLRSFLQEKNFPEIDIANLNTPSQIVVSGPKESIKKLRVQIKDTDARFVPLNVGGAFHSRLMAEAGSQFKEFLSGFEFNEPEIPTISNYTARPYTPGSVRDNLSMQLTNSVKWSESICYLMGKNVETFEEVGHGTILSNMVAQIRREAIPLIVNDTPAYHSVSQQTASTQKVPPSGTNKIHSETNFKVEARSPSKNQRKELSQSPLSVSPQKQFVINRLGCAEFKKDYGADYAYIVGPMHSGISSIEMVERCSKAGILSFFGADRLPLAKIRNAIDYLVTKTKGGTRFGVGMSFERFDRAENKRIAQVLEAGVSVISVSGYIHVTPALVKYRLKGLSTNTDGSTLRDNHIVLKTFRPEVAREFMRPAATELIEGLLNSGEITREQARLGRTVSVADDICVEVNGGGLTSLGSAEIVIPLLTENRREIRKEYHLQNRVRIGLAGGIGTPYAAASAFVKGVDFVMSGSINQCTVEAGQSDLVKSMLEKVDVHDTEYIPTDEMLSSKTKVQILKKGVFFPAKATRLYEIFRAQESIASMPPRLKDEVEKKYLKKSFAEVMNEIVENGEQAGHESLDESPKYELELILRWYYDRSIEFALKGEKANVVDFNIYTSGAIGACNQWLRGTPYEPWNSRHAEEIGVRLMQEADEIVRGTLGNLQLRYSA